MNKIALSIITVGLIVSIGLMIYGGQRNDLGGSLQPNQNIEIKDGVQYITIIAKGGYSPRLTSAEAGIPTKLIVETSGTYDCSAALVIRSIGYQKILSKTGREEIDLGTNKAGSSIRGTCSMGMYNFAINFN